MSVMRRGCRDRLERGCGGVDRMWPSGSCADSFPFIPMWQRAHPALRGTADRQVQDHSEPRQANVRRRVHRWDGPLTTRQHRCYSRTLDSRSRAVAITQAVGSGASRHSFGFCLSTVFRRAGLLQAYSVMPPSLQSRPLRQSGDVGVMPSATRYREGQLARGTKLARRSTEQPKTAPVKPTTTTWDGALLYKF